MKKKTKYMGTFYAEQVHPVKKVNADSVGFTMTRAQAKQFGEGLITAAQDPDPVLDDGLIITGFRHIERKDGTKKITIVSARKA